MKTMIINGIEFERIDSYKTNEKIEYNKKHFDRDKNLYTCYKNPSDKKEQIYYEWMRWCFDTNDNEHEYGYQIFNFGINEASCYQFSLFGLLSWHYEIIGYIEITKCHNRVYIIPNSI